MQSSGNSGIPIPERSNFLAKKPRSKLMLWPASTDVPLRSSATSSAMSSNFGASRNIPGGNMMDVRRSDVAIRIHQRIVFA